MNETGNLLIDTDWTGPAQDGKAFEAPLDGRYSDVELVSHNVDMLRKELHNIADCTISTKFVKSIEGNEQEYITKVNVYNETSLEQQVGGEHYKNFAIQPVEFIHKNNLGFIVGNIIKYICRYKDKNGIEDLKKAKHYIDMLIELEEKEQEDDYIKSHESCKGS